jgi:tRNA(Leu) C34 or U34 (ribose-2'-O)-methylase TrmL
MIAWGGTSRMREPPVSDCTGGLELDYTARMAEPRTRGYFGIGAEGVSKSANVGALLRTGHAFGASFCFTIGTGWDSRAARTADTADTPSHVPMWRYPTLTDLSLPIGCALVGIELLDDAVDLPSFRHPLNAAYVLGPERAGLSAGLLDRCDHVIRIPTRFSLNLAVAGAPWPVGGSASSGPRDPTGRSAKRPCCSSRSYSTSAPATARFRENRVGMRMT